jgi:DNA replication protein DnaC
MNKFGKPSEEDFQTVCEVLEGMTKKAQEVVQARLRLQESRLEKPSLSSDNEEAAESKEGELEVLRQLEEEQKAEEAVAKVATKNQSHSTTVTFGNDNSGFQAGTINGGVSGISFGRK